MADAVGLAWHQYRLERRMFWRNPSAAFFNFVAAAAVPRAVRRDLQRQPGRPRRDRARHRRHGRHVDDVQRAGDEPHLPARAGRAQAHARHAAAERRLPRRDRRQRGDERGDPDHASSCSPGRLFFGIGWPKDWLELVVFVVTGVVCLAVARRRVVARDPELRRRAGLREHRLPAGRSSSPASSTTSTTRPQFLRDIAQALPLTHIIDGLCGAMVTGAGLGDNLCGLGVIMAVGRRRRHSSRCAGFSWDQRRA